MAITDVENAASQPEDVNTSLKPSMDIKDVSGATSLSNEAHEVPLPDNVPAVAKTRENLFMVFITLTQLVQMIPLGAGINSGLAIGEALGANGMESVWIVASYPLTQGSFVLIGEHHSRPSDFFARRKSSAKLTSFSLTRRPIGCHLWPQEHPHRRLRVVDRLGVVRWIFKQPHRNVHNERSLRNWRRLNGPKRRGAARNHISSREQAES